MESKKGFGTRHWSKPVINFKCVNNINRQEINKTLPHGINQIPFSASNLKRIV